MSDTRQEKITRGRETGGQHRSVYIVDRIARQLRKDGLRVLVSHRELKQ
ncbi:MAG TPA: hypothetical protein VK972_01410 [Wenzhouxiangella sp.]|nr:hypothetical protein [Wenzhouxiangella sp.]